MLSECVAEETGVDVAKEDIIGRISDVVKSSGAGVEREENTGCV